MVRKAACTLLMLCCALALAGCGPAAAPSPAASPTANPSPVPTSTPSPTPPPTPTPDPRISGFTLSGPVADGAAGQACAPGLPEGGFVLGADPGTCDALGGATYTALVDVPAGQGNQLLVLRVDCPGGCADAVQGRDGTLALAVDGQVLWRAACDSAGVCDALALGDGPAASYVSAPGTTHTITLSTQGALRWAVAGVRLERLDMPTLVQGLAYSPYRDCQNPHWGPDPSEAQVREDMALLRHLGSAIRTYSSTDIEGQIPAIAQEYGLPVAAGAWLDNNPDSNEEQIQALIALAERVPLESVIVGNEVLLRGDLSEAELIAYIERVKAAVDVPVTTAEVSGVLVQHPEVLAAVDYVMVHIYPFWEWGGVPIESAARFTLDVYGQVQALAGGKRVVIGETGWPAHGPANGAALPSPENQRRFMREFLTLAQQEGIEFYYFATFDELWKTEGGVGPYWGIMGPERGNKYDLSSVLVPLNDVPEELAAVPAGPAVTVTAEAGGAPQADYFGVYTNYAVYSGTHHPGTPRDNHFAPSGWMGDLEAIRINDCALAGTDWGDRSIQVDYLPGPNDAYGWAGIYWQYPDSNWGTSPEFYDLSAYSRVTFRARSSSEGAEVKFLVGGVRSGPYPSSIRSPVFAEGADWDGFVVLSTEWQTFSIDLSGVDRSHVIDGFGWVAQRARTPDGVTVYLDDVMYLP